MAAFSDFRAPLARTLAGLTAVLVLASCGGSGEEAPQGASSSHSAPQDASSSSPAVSSPTAEEAADNVAPCADTTGKEAVGAVLIDLPQFDPSPRFRWDQTTATTDTYDPCADLSWAELYIVGSMGSSPRHLLLFHHGEYVGTATKDPVIQMSDVTRVSDGEITARLGMGSGAGAPIPAPTTIRWDDAKNAVVTTGASAPSSAEGTTVTAGAACASGFVAIADLDPAVCGDASGATTLNPHGSAIVTSPSGNIWCAMSADLVDCVMLDPFARIDLGTSGPALVPNRDDGPPGVPPRTLAYGQSVTLGPFACLSQSIGLSCWNTSNGHGMFLARERTAMW